jgi:PAS domain S-box-containing protein
MVAGLIEHSRVEEARRESQKHLASIYDTVKDVIFHLAVEPEKQFRFVSANAAFLRVTGTSAQSVVGKTVNEVIPEPSRTMVVGKYEQAIKERTTVSWEETSDYPVGRLTGEVSVAPVFDDQGTCTHLVGSVHDITEFKRIEAGLRESEERLKRAECLAHLGHLDLNLKTGRIEWSEQVLRILGCPDGFNAGLTGFYEIVSPPDRERVKQWVRDCLATKKGGPIELRVMRPGGDLRTLSVTSEIFLDQDGRLARLFGSCHDVTEMKAFEVQILQNQRDLRALTARLVDIQESGMKELACELHDELSQDLALLGMGMSALRSPSDALHPSFPERLRALEAQAWKLANDVYSMAMRLHPVILHDLGLEAALREECRGFEERTGIPVQFTSEGQKVELGQDVLLCFFRVAQEGFHNIARHAGATNVRLTLSGGNGNCTLRIDDNGRGFDPTATEGRSSLGLVSMRERMRLVNGSFTIQSHPGEGTTLEFSAPSAVGQWQT